MGSSLCLVRSVRASTVKVRKAAAVGGPLGAVGHCSPMVGWGAVPGICDTPVWSESWCEIHTSMPSTLKGRSEEGRVAHPLLALLAEGLSPDSLGSYISFCRIH